MRKFIATFLVLSILLAFPVAAAQTDLPEVVVFDLCDSKLGWSKYAPNALNLKVDGEVYTEAPTSIWMSNDLPNDKILTASVLLSSPVDAGENDQFVFDMYIEDKEIFNGANGQIELTSGGGPDVEELAWSPGGLYSSLQNGWNTVTLLFKNASRGSTTPEGFDKSSIDFFRMFILNPNSSDTDYILRFDNMRFTCSTGNKAVQTEPVEYELPLPIEPADETIVFGDITGNGSVASNDALAALQYGVGKIYLKGMELTAADANGDGSINAVDALLILQYSVNKISAFGRNQTIEANDYLSQVNREGTRLITPYYETDDAVVAVADVIYFGAAGDGVTDDTDAFRKALAYADSIGGGIVFVPAGNYVIRKTLHIPDGVTLRGDAPDEPQEGRVEGTVIYSYVGYQSESGAPLIYVNAGSGVKNMAIYYPQQKMDDIQPCSYTIVQRDQYGPTVESVLFVNSYNGIKFGPGANALQTVRNVAGTVLKNGYFIDYNVDICRVENVSFSPDYWLKSGLGEEKEEALRDYVKTNCTAFIVEHVDWTYLTDISVEGAKIAMHTRQSTLRDSTGSPNGQIFNFSFTDCYIGYYGEMVNPIGHMFTNGVIEAYLPVWLPETSVWSTTYNNIDFISSGENAVKIEAGSATFSDCTFEMKTGNAAYAVNSSGGADLSVINSAFSGSGSHFYVSPGSKAQTINCMTEQTLKVSGDSTKMKAVWDSTAVTKTVESEDYDYERNVRTKPLGNAFVDVSEAPYSIVPDFNKDISSELQSAIDDVAELGGGVVYVPSGKYRLSNPITVKMGVELRGSCDTTHHSHVPSTIFYTAWGKNKPYDYEAVINLESQSGIQGFKVMYDDQQCAFSLESAVTPYSYTIRGDGYNIWIINISLTNSYYGVDLFTNRCDYHYVEGLTGTPLKTGIKTGGMSAYGLVRDTQFNVHYWGDNPLYRVNTDYSQIFPYCIKNVESIVMGQTVNEIYYNNFMLGAKAGLVIEDNPRNAFILAHGSDGANYSMYARGTAANEVLLVNSQFVCVGGYSMEYIYIEDTFDGELTYIQTNFWGAPNNASYLGNGKVNIYQGTLLRCGTNGMQVIKGELNMAGIVSLQSDTLWDVKAGKETQAINIFGNIYKSGGKFFDPYAKIKGADTISGGIAALPDMVNFNLCESTAGWSKHAPTSQNVKLDTLEYTQGKASVWMGNDLANDKALICYLTLETPVDMGNNNQLTFDMYVEDVSIFNGAAGQIELTSSGRSDSAEVCWFPGHLYNNGLKNGWNTVTLTLSKNCAYSSTTELNFDKSGVNYFRLYILNIENEDTNYEIRFDNLRFTCSEGNKQI